MGNGKLRNAVNSKAIKIKLRGSKCGSYPKMAGIGSITGHVDDGRTFVPGAASSAPPPLPMNVIRNIFIPGLRVQIKMCF